MNSRKKCIALVDQHLDILSPRFSKIDFQNNGLVFLDPIQLFSEFDWSRFEEDVYLINKIYSRLFEEVVLEDKKLVCFWPLSEQFGSEWFELTSLCKASSYEIVSYKCLRFSDDNYVFSGEMLSAWKRFVYFLIESLLDDIQLTEGVEEIATLTSEQNSLILFKKEERGKVRYSFTFDLIKQKTVLAQIEGLSRNAISLVSFETFKEMLEKLMENNDLSLYQARFSDPQLEKTYFSILSREFKTKNLIENWIKFYSLN